MTNLGGLYLQDNQLTGPIPPELGSLANLGWLYLDGNQLTGSIPPELGNMTNLRELRLNDNQITGDIPTEFVNLINLGTLGLGGNQLSGCVPGNLRGVLGNLGGLPFCPLSPTFLLAACSGGHVVPNPEDNPGLVQDCVALLGARDTLAGDASLNWQEDRRISSWEGVYVSGSPPRVTHLNFGDIRLTGSIPPELGNLTNLKTLNLWENQLTGSIPPELGNLTNLTTLSFLAARMTGGIPPELGNLTSLETLNIWISDHLSGCVPNALRGVNNLWVGKPFCE